MANVFLWYIGTADLLCSSGQKGTIMHPVLRSALFIGIVALVAFVLVLVIHERTSTRSSSSTAEQEIVRTEFALTWTLRILGGLIAVVAAFALLVSTISGGSLDRLFPYILPLLAGVLLLTGHWSLPISLGAIGVALIAKDIFAHSRQAKV